MELKTHWLFDFDIAMPVTNYFFFKMAMSGQAVTEIWVRLIGSRTSLSSSM